MLDTAIDIGKPADRTASTKEANSSIEGSDKAKEPTCTNEYDQAAMVKEASARQDTKQNMQNPTQNWGRKNQPIPDEDLDLIIANVLDDALNHA